MTLDQCILFQEVIIQPLFFLQNISDYKLCGQQGRRVSMIRYDKNNLEFVNHVIKIKKVIFT